MNLDSVRYWTPNQFNPSSIKFKINRKETQLGTDNTGLCTYTYNELGFRSESIYKKGFRIMSIGCSNTEGVGVNNNQTWPHQFSKLILNGIDLNFGASGRSNDYISRCLLSYYDLIKPNLVLIMYTSPQRREVYTKNSGIKPFLYEDSWGFLRETKEGKMIQNNLLMSQNENEDFMNWYKNHLLIKLFLESKKCNWIWNGWFNIPYEYLEFNRFDGLYGKFVDYGTDGGHPGPQHNKIYAENLFKHIESNFPSYLPTENQTYESKLI